jgi:hypothetical protein
MIREKNLLQLSLRLLYAKLAAASTLVDGHAILQQNKRYA